LIGSQTGWKGKPSSGLPKVGCGYDAHTLGPQRLPKEKHLGKQHLAEEALEEEVLGEEAPHEYTKSEYYLFCQEEIFNRR
jgi:hypothetical protein